MEKLKTISIKVLVELSRILLGITFMFSGFTKAVDPWGTAYKIDDYFGAFGLSSLSFLSFPLSAVQSIAEFALGAFMLFGLYRFWTSRLILLIMCFMTPLTLYLAIANPVADCGCFGDALIISNWETFYKNILLTACSILTVVYYDRICNIFTGKTYWLAFLFISLFSVAFVIRNYIYEPLLDFRPYYIGANIPEGMLQKEGKERIEESALIYVQDGKEKEFTEDNFPWEDSTWVYVRTETKILQEGEEPKIKDFTITSLRLDNNRVEVQSQEDITEEVLTDTSYTFLMISPSLEKMSINYLSSFEDVDYYAKEYGYKFYCITASVTDDILQFIEKHSVAFEFCTMDERALKTISRSNPGLLLIKNGVIINKWADIDVPAEQDLKAPLEDLKYSQLVDIKKEDTRNIFYVSILFFLPLLLLKFLDFLAFRKKKKLASEEDI